MIIINFLIVAKNKICYEPDLNVHGIFFLNSIEISSFTKQIVSNSIIYVMIKLYTCYLNVSNFWTNVIPNILPQQ